MSKRPRVLVLTHHDSGGRHGLGPDLRAAEALGAEPLPVVTGFTLGGAGAPDKLWPVPTRVLTRALGLALAEEPEAAYVGLLPRRRGVRQVAELLRERGPTAIVVAPLSLAFDAQPLLGRGALSAVRKHLLPEARVAVVPGDQAPGLLPEVRDGLSGMREAGATLLKAGAAGAWLRAGSHEGRSVDVIVDGAGTGLLDYPTPRDDAEPHAAPAALAALLAIGVPVREAVDRAHQYAYKLDRAFHRAVR